MERNKALTVYVILPCLLFGIVFVAALTKLSTSVSLNQLRLLTTAFGVVLTLIVHTKKDELSKQ
ncbi:hypothetical protein C453_16248 [Haloferax elongans ATCC BAA-1513]|uniref:EamA domain-containing protein n=1 Tax=Haloferax elongans ATCC BAA-1513 TaxID=1230453 RepID=M0HFT8_HALEO|nr:hypothetical protein [Haloferax elongans]ELZ82653.1 hypothetical protein C453_16248 [Haloferax elongans ATCC BAA-1513]